MRQLLPTPSPDGIEVDAVALYEADDRPPHPDGRPWLLLNFVATADGATAFDGRSGPLGGGEADRAVFLGLRDVADVILVGAETVRAEDYGPPRPKPDVQAARVARGQAPAPRIAVITGSLELDPMARLFAEAEPDNRPLVLTTGLADPQRAATLAEVAEVVAAGEERVDVVQALAELGRRGCRVVLCEGGPTLAGQLVAAGLVDELCVSITPLLVAGNAARVTHGPVVEEPVGMHLARAIEHEGVLLLRYVRA